MRPLLALGILTLLHACAPGGRGADTKQYTLVEDLRIGGADTGKASFSGIAGLALDAQGGIWVLDRQAHEIRVFSRAGDFVRAVARQGEGPGEFVEANGFAVDARGLVWIPDHRLRRYMVVDTLGRAVGAHGNLIYSYGWLWNGLIDGEGRLIDGVHIRSDTSSFPALRRFRDTSLAVADTFRLRPCSARPYAGIELRAKNGAMFMSVPFTPTELSAVGADGRVWCSDGASFTAIARDIATGDSLAAISYAHPRLPVTSQMRDSAVAAIHKVAGEMGAPDPDLSGIPAERPAIEWMRVDDQGRLWIRTPRDGASTHFDLFDQQGRHLAEVDVAVRLEPWSPVAFRGDTLLAVVEDDDDVPSVVRMHLAPAPPAP
jgi:hypothetical protein